MKKYKSYIAAFFAIIFMSITFPELIFTDDTVKVTDQDQKEIFDFSDLPGDTLDRIKNLYDSLEKGNVTFRTKYIAIQYHNQK